MTQAEALVWHRVAGLTPDRALSEGTAHFQALSAFTGRLIERFRHTRLRATFRSARGNAVRCGR